MGNIEQVRGTQIKITPHTINEREFALRNIETMSSQNGAKPCPYIEVVINTENDQDKKTVNDAIMSLTSKLTVLSHPVPDIKNPEIIYNKDKNNKFTLNIFTPKAAEKFFEELSKNSPELVDELKTQLNTSCTLLQEAINRQQETQR